MGQENKTEPNFTNKPKISTFKIKQDPKVTEQLHMCRGPKIMYTVMAFYIV